MLTASITLHRKPKNGTDGVGITSADVVFAQSKSNTNPPADSDNWKTKVDELTLVDGYLWSGTKIVYSNKKTAITGKYCIGSTRDYTDIEELYYLSDSGDKIPTGVTFQSSFKPEKGKYLWTCIRYRFKAASGAAENSNWVYSTPTCACYFGDDGVSVKSSDVVFGIGTKTQQPTSWITNFSELTLEKGKYVWTCTKTILTSSSTPIYTGAYCLGECYDFAQVEELYALSDSSTNTPDVGNFASSYKVVKGKYLWSCVKVTYSGGSIDYLNIRCVNYFPTDGNNGTKFTPKGTAYAHYSKASELPTPSVVTVNRKYLVDVDDKSTPAKNTPCVCYYKNTTTFMSDVAEDGDAYNIGGTLWVHDGKVWHDFGSVQGPKGDDGEDALNIELSTDKILFSWDSEKGYNVATKDITLVVKQGNNIININDYTVNFQAVENFELGSNNKNIRTDEASDGYTYNISVYSDGIAMIEYTFNASVNGKEHTERYPASSCSVKMLITYNGITYTKIIAIEVSFVKMYGDLAWNTEQISSTYGDLVGEGGRLVQMETLINQNAKNITLTAKRTDGLETQYSEIKVQYNNINISVGNINDGLAATGINITDGTINMTANKFKLYNNNKDEVFSADENGNGVFKGKVTATSGNIGGLEIYNDIYQFGGQTFNYKGLAYNIEEKEYVPEHTVNVRDRGFYVGFGNSKMGGYLSAGLNGNGGTTTVGGQTEMSYYNILDVLLSTEKSVTGQSVTAASFTAASKGFKSTAIEVSAYGGRENYAVDARSGDIRVQDGAFIGAFCGNVNKGNNSNNVTDNYTLKPTDSIIVCNNTKEIKITFPREGIKAGQMFIVIAGTSSRINFGGEYGTVTSILCQGELYCGTRGQWNFILFDGKTWHIRMVWN